MLELENCFKYMEINKVLESTSRILDIGQGQCFVWLISKFFQVLFSTLYYLHSYKRQNTLFNRILQHNDTNKLQEKLHSSYFLTLFNKVLKIVVNASSHVTSFFI